MLSPALSPACYTENSWFELEKKNIFSTLWLFAGLSSQIEEDNSFITRNLNGIPILIQNLKGQLYAFRNSCPHRGMPLQIEAFGNRKLICPYHGWSFQENGNLRSIPNEKIYNICDKKTIKLQSFAITCIGKFIFINLSPAPLTIHQQFSTEVIDYLNKISKYFSTSYSHTHFHCNYNWKLNFENILDWNHIQFIHKNTFSPLLNYKENEKNSKERNSPTVFSKNGVLGNISQKKEKYQKKEIHISDLSCIDRAQMPYKNRWFSDFFLEAFDKGSISTAHIFPNLNIGCLHGESFYIQQYNPLAPNITDFHSWILTAKLKKENPPPYHLLWGMHHAEKRVIDEDRVLLEALQNALSNATDAGIMGDYEYRQHAMGRWYMENIIHKN